MAKDMKVKDYVAQMQSGRSFVKAKNGQRRNR